jgi:L-alanine-DL-glutamate epimerase-like enolase superfamily enzyme
MLTLTSLATLRAEIERWPLVKPFSVTGYTWHAMDMLLVSVEQHGHVGRGEAAGVYYRNETAASMLVQIESLRTKNVPINRLTLQDVLPLGGARNAVDCALWDLEAKVSGAPAWQTAGLDQPRPLLTTFTCGANDPAQMAVDARAYAQARAIKVKLTGEPIDAERIRAIRDARPDVWLGVDANQGFSRAFLEKLMPTLMSARVALIEQPFPIGQDSQLDGFDSPIPMAADESVQGVADISNLKGRFDLINIKLDKCGGLTEALSMARAARNLGLGTMVGNMTGTSLAIAPAFLVGQLCEVVDLDGPVFLETDREDGVRYENGLVNCPKAVWGHR